MTNNSSIARLIEALKNPDTGPENRDVSTQESAGTRGQELRGKAQPISTILEYALITTYVSFAALMFLPPYFATIGRIVSNLLRSL